MREERGKIREGRRGEQIRGEDKIGKGSFLVLYLMFFLVLCVMLLSVVFPWCSIFLFSHRVSFRCFSFFLVSCRLVSFVC